MESKNIISIADLLCYLREQLLDARSKQEHESLRNLWKAVSVFTDAAYLSQDRQVASILEDMDAAIRDSLTGEEWRSEIPSIEELRKLEKRES